MRKALLLLGLLVMVLLANPASALGCRTIQEVQEDLIVDPDAEAPMPKLPDGDYWIQIDRGHPATFEVREGSEKGRRLRLSGSVCSRTIDKKLAPLPDLRFQLIRYTGKRPDGVDFTESLFYDGTFKIEKDWPLKSRPNGEIKRSGLKPGKYAIIPNWEHLTTSALVFDFRVIP